MRQGRAKFKLILETMMKSYGINGLSQVMAGVAATILIFFMGGMANAITFTYTDTKSSCKSLTISPTGTITCNTTGTNAIPFNFNTQLSCRAGLDINTSTGLVKCATTLPECTSLSASSTSTVAPGETVTLTATCSNTPTGYQWSSTWASSPAPVQQPNTNTATVTIPAASSTGYHSYSVMASNSVGYGSSASVNLKVAVPGQSGPYAYIPSNTGKVSVLNTASNTISPSTVTAGTFGVAVHPSGIKTYVTNQGQNTVSVIDTATNKVIHTVNLMAPSDPALRGEGPAGVAITPDGRYIYVANTVSQNVTVIDALTNTIIKAVALPPGSNPVGVAVVKKSGGTQFEVFVANSGSNKVSVIDTATQAIKATAYTENGPYGVAVKPDGTKVYVTNSISNSVTEIDTGTYQSRGIFPPGAQKPQGIAVKPDGTEVYVVNQDSGTVSVINATDNTIASTITGLGSLPYNVAFSPSGSLAYVTNTYSGNVSILDTTQRAVVDTVAVGGAPYALGQFIGPANPYLGLWYKPGEDGWGISITEHGSMMFVAIYTYDQSGQPTWYVMSSCPIAGTSCTGDLYEVTGGTLPTAAWNGSNLKVNSAGTGTLTFADADSGTFSFTINGVAGSKAISRQVFGAGSTTPSVYYTDLWWNAGESGWGVALTQQFDKIFATWYAYDAAGKATWYVASDCAVTNSGCQGVLYQTSGGTPLTSTWNAANYKTPTPVGTIGFTFTDAGTGTMTYNINGETGSKPITRQPF